MLDDAPGAGKKYTFTLFLNGNPTALTFDIADAATSGSDMVNEVVVTGGDYVYLQCVPDNTPTTTQADWTTVFEGDNPNESLILGRASNTLHRTNTYYGQVMTCGTSLAANENDRREVIPTSGKIKNFYVKLDIDPGTAPDAYRLTVRLNGATVGNSPIVTITANDTTGSDLVHELDVVASDYITMMAEPVNTPSAWPYVCWGMTFEADIDGESICIGGSYQGLDRWNPLRFNKVSSTEGPGWDANEDRRDLLGQVCTLKKFHVLITAPPGAGNHWDFTLRIGGADSNVLLAINDPDTTGDSGALEDTVALDEYVALRCDPTDIPDAADAYWGFVCYIAPSGSEDLLGKFDVGQDSADLLSHFEVGQGSAELLGKFEAQATAELLGRFEAQATAGLFGRAEVRQPDSAGLLGEAEVQQLGSVELLGKAEVRQPGSAELLGNGIIRHSDAAELLGKIEVQHSGSAELLGRAVIRHVGTPVELLGKAEVQQSGSVELLDKFEVQQLGSAEFFAELIIRQKATLELPAEFIVRHEAGVDLHAAFESQATVDLLGELIVRHSATINLPGKFIVRHSATLDLLGEFIVRQVTSENLLGELIVRHLFSQDLAGELIARQSATLNILGELIARHLATLDLLGEFIVRQVTSEDLLGELIARHLATLDLLGEFIIRQVASEDLLGELIVKQEASVDLHAAFESQATVDLLGELIVRQSATINLPGKFTVKHSAKLDLPAKFQVVHWERLLSKLWIRHPSRLWTNRRYVNGVVELDETELDDALLEYIIQGVMDDIKSQLISEAMLIYDSWTDITETPKLIRRATTYGTVASLYSRDINDPNRRIVMGLRPIRIRATEVRSAQERAMDYWESRMEKMMSLYLTSGGRSLMIVDTEDEEAVFSLEDIPFYSEDPFKIKVR